MPMLNAAGQDGARPLLILCETAEASALGMLVHNMQSGALQAVVVRAPGLRPPAHPAPRGHRRVLRRHRHRRGGRACRWTTVEFAHFGTARRVIVTAGRLHLHRGRRLVRGGLGPARAAAHGALARGPRPRRRDPPGAHRAPVGEPRGHPRGRAERGRPEGAHAPHRGRPGRHPGRGVRGRRARRRNRAAALRERDRRARAVRRLRPRRGDRPVGPLASRCTGSPPTPATTARPRSTRSSPHRTATG